MAGRKRRAAPTDDAVPSVYREMLAEAGPSTTRNTQSPPLKRKRPGERPPARPAAKPTRQSEASAPTGDVDDGGDGDDDDEDIEFEDVSLPTPTLQTIMRDSEEEEDEEDGDDDDIRFEDVSFEGPGSTSVPSNDQPKDLNLNLTAQKAAMTPRRSVDRRKPMTKEEKLRRVEVHKMHLLCLLSHVALRNWWCNSPEVQAILQPHLTEKLVKYLNPGENLSQFGRTESLKNGLHQASEMFRIKFTITERGLRRALWADSEQQLQDYQLPDDIESTLEKADFVEAAKSLRGSRDVGAQLFCALLRAAGVETRLVCSLQPLACAAGAPSMPKQRNPKTPSKKSKAEQYAAAMAVYEAKHTQPSDPTAISSPLRRLGHPHAAAYNIPVITPPTTAASRASGSQATRKPIRGESSFPVYWVEVLDVAHQKWQPVDPFVTRSQWKPKVLEPPASDRDNCMAYVIAFEEDGSAKDVTRRYVKAYNSKTRKMRVDGATDIGGDARGRSSSAERWWRRAMRRYAKQWPTDVDEIENNELTAEETREPMPRNVADFKDHPVFALERHLRRHEVIVPGAQMAGTIGAGSKAPLERIYRRRDVRMARSADKWYRLGREVRIGQEPVKVLPKRAGNKNALYDDDDDDDDPDKVGLFGDEAGGTPIYTFEQTELYRPDPVVRGRVPKNKFGNLDVYVPSMVPQGGVHIVHERAAEAAFKLGVDYAPALTGFQFKGRRGTAVLTGIIIPSECEDGVRAVIAGLEDLDAEIEQERRALKALRMWSRFLKALRIRERIWAGVEPDEADQADDVDHDDKGKGRAVSEDADIDDAESDVTEEYTMDVDEEGGGFLIE